MPSTLCFGEILWDILPPGLFPGGAPFNVAYHLKQHRIEALLVSAVGRDLLGDELLRRLHHWNLTADLVTRHHGLPTGTVRASLSTSGDASYEITPSVAWDQIFVTHDSTQAATNADALVFGSLALRSPFNRTALDRLLAVLPESSLRIFDVNLRPPHDDLELVRALAGRATVLKLNAAEAARLAASQPESPGQEESHARTLASRHNSPFVIITAGARGAGLLHRGDWHWETSRPVDASDTVGAGDSFLASFTAGLLAGQTDFPALLGRACRLGEWVATQRGATPPYDTSTPLPPS